jgi:hypothetical protein
MNSGVLCDGITFQNESIEFLEPNTRIMVRYNRTQAMVEFSTSKLKIGVIRDVHGADLCFFCFVDGTGSWTITSTHESNRIFEVKDGLSCSPDSEKKSIPISGMINWEGKNVFCQKNPYPQLSARSIFQEKCPFRESLNTALSAEYLCFSKYSSEQSCVHGLSKSDLTHADSRIFDFDPEDSSNEISIAKMSLGSTVDRPASEFFSDFGNHSDCSDEHPSPQNLRLPMSSSENQQQHFPPEGQLFLDCWPLEESDILDPAFDLLNCPCKERKEIFRHAALSANLDSSALPGYCAQKSLMICVDCGKVF